MALTPDDVLNKRFQTTKFRDGYDQDEVDDYLDDIVEALRSLTKERDTLQEKLTASEAKVAELQHALDQAPATKTAAAPAAPKPVQNQAPTSDDDATDESTSLLQLARKLHDEHVKEGEQKRDALIAEANVTSSHILAEAEQRKTKILSSLEQRRATLQNQIRDLESFEKEYRGSLKVFIQRQLGDLESTGSLAESAQSSLRSGK